MIKISVPVELAATPQPRHDRPTRLNPRGRASEMLGEWVTQIHISDRRSVDASWGTRCVGKTEKGWAGTRCKRENPCDRGAHSARGTDHKALTRGPRHATSELHQHSLNVTGGVELLENFCHSPAKRRGSTNVITHPGRLMWFGTRVSDACTLTLRGTKVGRPGLTVASMRDRTKRRYSGVREPLPTRWVERSRLRGRSYDDGLVGAMGLKKRFSSSEVDIE